MWSVEDLTEMEYLDVKPPKLITKKESLWQMGNRYIASADDVVYATQGTTFHMSNHPSFAYIYYNGPHWLQVGYNRTLHRLVPQSALARVKFL
eukprot:jgi/Chrzof1/9979/Cz04g22200.t1